MWVGVLRFEIVRDEDVKDGLEYAVVLLRIVATMPHCIALSRRVVRLLPLLDFISRFTIEFSVIIIS